jgi:hypothetical protein
MGQVARSIGQSTNGTEQLSAIDIFLTKLIMSDMDA